jgi:hypothetical protein
MNFIKTYPDSLDPEYCKDIINRYTNEYGGASLRTKSNLHATVKEISLSSKGKLFWDDLEKTLKKITKEKVLNYLRNDLLNFESYNFGHVALMHHREMYNIPLHYDAEMIIAEEKEVLRRFAILIYLNDDFDGGELLFPVQRVSLKPEPGLLVIFPTSYMYPHLTTPTFGKDRYVLRISYFLKE